jgi:hypothetical protein
MAIDGMMAFDRVMVMGGFDAVFLEVCYLTVRRFAGATSCTKLPDPAIAGVLLVGHTSARLLGSASCLGCSQAGELLAAQRASRAECVLVWSVPAASGLDGVMGVLD